MSSGRNNDEGTLRSPITLVRELRNGNLSASNLQKEDRRSCVEYLTGEGYSAAQIAEILKITTRTVYRDRECIRTRNAVSFDPDFLPKQVGQLMYRAKQARQESKDLSKVTIRGLLSKSETGHWMGGTPPYGYDLLYENADGKFLFILRYMPDGSKQVLDKRGKLIRTLVRSESLSISKQDHAKLTPSSKERVNVIKRIFKMYAEQSKGFKSLAYTLNKEDIPTARGPQWSYIYSGSWASTTIKAIIVNPIYVGDMVWNRRTDARFHRISGGRAIDRDSVHGARLVPNDKSDWIVVREAHPALVPRRLFQQARQRLDSRIESIEQRGQNPRLKTSGRTWAGRRSRFILSGLVKCALCGSRYQGVKRYKGSIKHDGVRILTFYYGCGGYITKGTKICNFNSISQEILENKVIDTVLDFYGPYLEKGGREKMAKAVKDKIGSDGQDPQQTQTQTIEYAYNLLDALKIVTDSLGYENENFYDDDENLIAVQDAESKSKPTEPEKYFTDYEYDERDLLQKITDAESAETTYAYGSNGNLLSITDAKSQVTTYEYDDFGRLVKITYPENSASVNTTEEFGYDNNSNIVWKKNRSGDVTYYDYDAVNRLTRKTIDDNSVLDIIFDDEPEIISGTWAVESQALGKYGLTYLSSENASDTCQFQSTVETAETYIVYAWWPEAATAGSVTVNIYNNTTLIGTDSIDQTQNSAQWNEIGSFTFDSGTAKIQIVSQGTLITCADAVRFVPASLPMTEYLYDVAGRVLQVNDQDDTTDYHYDDIGRVSQVDDQQSRSVSYGYDNLSRRTDLTYPGTDGFIVKYVYDEMSRLTDITDNSEPTPNVYAHYDYDELSRREAVTYDNSAVINYNYEDLVTDPETENNLSNRLEQVDNDINGSDYITFDYTYDKVGNRTEMVTDSDTFSYGYDNIYQLTKYDFTGSSFDYFYDPLGSRDYINLDTVTITDYDTKDSTNILYDNYLNQYGSVGPVGSRIDYSYDANGNLISDGVSTYTYDAQNRFVSAATPSHNSSYEYDHLGRQVSKTVDSTTIYYCYDGDQVIAEYDNYGVVLRRFIYGPGIDEPICTIIPAGQANAGTYFYHFDGLGSVVALSNTSGNIVETYSYDAFGETTVTLDGSTGNPYRFTGRRFDSETNLYYYRARMYAPQLGRFLQPDPIGYDDGMNMYTYVGNNPASFTDPFGLCKGDKSFGRKLWEGKYFGTGYGASSTDIWAERAVASKTWYGKAGNYFMGGLSALWTPETYKQTTVTLVGSYGLRNAGRVWHLRDGTQARTVVDYGNAVRIEKHMIGKGAARASRWHIDGLWESIRHWPWNL